MMSQPEKEKNTKALIWSLVTYGILIGACVLAGFSVPPPLPNQDMGMEINLGTSTEGTGTIQPLSPNPAALQNVKTHEAQASPASDRTGGRSEDIMTQNTADAPVIKKLSEKRKDPAFSKDLKENTKHTTRHPRPDAPVEPKPTPPKPKAIYSGGTANSNSSGNNAGASNDATGEGLTGKPGDQGAANGNPTATNHNGTYSGLGGNSLSYRLGGRQIVQYPSREGAFNEPGKVKLSIKVDQQGNIVGYHIISADNPTISRLAEKKIKEVKFNASPDAPVVQFGEIVFVFKIQH
jgi:outer membrane biosynthesis protein TonB